MGTVTDAESRKDRPRSSRSGAIVESYVVVRCSEQVSRSSRRLHVRVATRPGTCEYQKGDFAVLLRRFRVRAVFPGGEVVSVRPDVMPSRSFGSRSETRSDKQGSESQGGLGHQSAGLQLLAQLKSTRNRESTVTRSDAVELLEICTSVPCSDTHVAEWLIRFISPDRLARLTLAEPDETSELADYYHFQTVLEAGARSTSNEKTTVVAVCLEEDSLFLMRKPDKRSALGTFLRSLPLQKLLRSREMERLRYGLLERAPLSCEVA